jgi:ABC-2 type transport system permease protein
MCRLLWKAWVTFARDFAIDMSYRVTFAIALANSLLMALSYMFLARLFGGARPDGYDARQFLLVGIAVSDGLSTVLACFAQGVRGTQVSGTIKAVMATPTPPAVYLLLSSGYPIVRALADVVILLGMGSLVGLRLASANVAGGALALGLGLCAMAALGMLAAAFTVVFKRGDPIAWLLGSVTWLLSGVLYPTSVLPAWLGRLAWWLPPTHTLTALRALVIDGAPLAAVAPSLWYLAACAALGLPLSLWIFARAVTHAKRQGTLGHI